MTDQQAVKLFMAIGKAVFGRPRDKQHNIRPEIEPIIDEMLAEARAEGEAAAKGRLGPK